MPVGRPQRADPNTLYFFANFFYWDFRRLAEGSVRWYFDKNKYRQLTEGIDDRQLIDGDDRASHQQMVDEEIRAGRIEASRREEILRDIADSEISARRAGYHLQAAEDAKRRMKVPGEADVIEVLLNPKTTPQQIRDLCKRASMIRDLKIGAEVRQVEVPAWPIPLGSTLPTYLAQYAEEYVSALRDRRFPRCAVSIRPTNRLKQLWFLSRALAGALHRVTTRTAINLVGSLRPEQMFHKSRDGKPARKLRRVKRK